MALVNSDLLVVQKADSGDLRKVTVRALMNEAAGDVNSVNGKIGIVVLDAADVGAATAAQGTTADSALQPGEAATTAQGTKADSAVQPGDDISELNNDAGYITAASIPDVTVVSVNSQTGEVVLNAADVGAATTAQGATADSAIQPGDDNTVLNNAAGYITAEDIPTLDYVPLGSWAALPVV